MSQQDQTAMIRQITQAFDEDDFSTAAGLCQKLLWDSKQIVDSKHRIQLILLHVHSLIEIEEYNRATVVLSLTATTETTTMTTEQQQRLYNMKLYCWYKKQDYKKITDDTKTVDPTDNVAAACLRAQSLFHQGSTAAAAELFEKLLRDDDRLRVATNQVSATSANAVPYCGGPTDAALESLLELCTTNSSEPYYDLAFNIASMQLLTGQTERKRWMDLLDEAEENCKASNDEASLPQELAPIQLNRQVFRCMYESLPTSSIYLPTGDLSTPLQAVVDANRSLSKPPNETLLSLLEPPHPKWTPLQQRSYFYNRAVAQLYSKKYKECRATCRTIKDSGIFWESRVAVLLAYCARHDNGDKKVLSVFINKCRAVKPITKESDQALLYALLHQSQLQHEPLQAETLPAHLQALPAVQSHLNESEEDANNDPEACMKAGKYERAAELYKVAAGDGDLLAKARWIRALSYVDPVLARKEWSQQEGTHSMTTSSNTTTISGLELEQREIPTTTTTHSTPRARAVPTEPATSTRNKKKSHSAVLRYRAKQRAEYLAALERKGRRIKEHPDPERWLPKNTRGGAAQGGLSSKEAAKWDIVARQNTAAAPSSSAHLSVKGSRKGGKRR